MPLYPLIVKSLIIILKAHLQSYKCLREKVITHFI